MPRWITRTVVCAVVFAVIMVACSNPTPPPATTAAPTLTSAATSAATASVTSTKAVAATCPQIVKTALQAIADRCNAIGSNQACYGNPNVEATTANNVTFKAPGDIANLADLKMLRTTSMNVGAGTWGIAVIKAAVNLPGTTAGQQVTFLLYGDTTIDSMSGDMKTVSFRTNIGPQACNEVPQSGLVVQVPRGQRIKFTANGAEIDLGSTALFRADPNNEMVISVLQGKAQVAVGGVSHDVPEGFQSKVPLRASVASGPPSEPQPIPVREVAAAPVEYLGEPVSQQQVQEVIHAAATQVILTATLRPTQPTSTPGTPQATITPALTWTPGPTLPPASGGGSRILYASNQNGNWEIYVMNADGSSPQRLTNRNGDDKSPAWSADGKRIAWASYTGTTWQIYTMNDNASDMKPLSPADVSADHPAWSPDGSLVAYDALKDNNRDIWLIGADGNNARAIASNPADDSEPAWSPDGKRLAFVSMRDGNKEIYVMDADGGNLTRLTNNPGEDRSPVWSPDGTRMTFVSSRSGSSQIYLINTDGKDIKRLMTSPASDDLPTWSPDGAQIAFVSNREGTRAIYVVDVADPKTPRRLTDLTADSDSPDWQRR